MIAVDTPEACTAEIGGCCARPDVVVRVGSLDDLTDEKIPLVARNGGTVIGRLTGEHGPTIADIRNSLAHGDPFEGAPWGSLLELVRDLVHYAYRRRETTTPIKVAQFFDVTSRLRFRNSV